MKSLPILIFFLIYLLKLNNSQVLPEDQQLTAQYIIKTLFGEDYPDPCEHPEAVFVCYKVDSNYFSVFEFNCPNAGDIINLPKTLTNDFSVFVNLTKITIGSHVTVPNIWNNISLLKNLNYLEISNQVTEIPSSVILPPKNFDLHILKISVPIPSAFFSTSGLYGLYIEETLKGFSLPSTIPLNEGLGVLSIPIGPQYYSLPTYMGTQFKNLTDLNLQVNNDINSDDYEEYQFPTFSPFENLANINIRFVYESDSNLQRWEFPKSIKSTFGVNYLEIYNQGFELPSSGILDLTSYSSSGSTLFVLFIFIHYSKIKDSNNFSNLYSKFDNVGFLDQCSSTSCLLLPSNSAIHFTNNNLNLTNIDFANVTTLYVKTNTLSQELPISSTINFDNIESFTLTESIFTGTIPDLYCKFRLNALNLKKNELSGAVPSCFTCVGGNWDGSSNILGSPNSFTNFNSSSTDGLCPTISFQSPPLIAKTNEETIITIKGKDFGWTLKQTSPPVSSTNPSLVISIPNNELVLTIPKGDGYDKQVIGTFGYNYKFIHPFTYSYEIPVLLQRYRWNVINGENIMILIGTGFSYVNTNLVNINGITHTASISTSFINSSGYDEITFSNSSTTSSLAEGDAFQAFVTVGGQASTSVNFYLVKPITITLENLYTVGGNATFSGVFPTLASSMFSTLYINGKAHVITSISENSISFSYSSQLEGEYLFYFNLGGLDFSAILTYVVAPIPTLVEKYSWVEANDELLLALTGTFFNYTGLNKVIINNQEYQASAALPSSITDYGMILLNDTNAIASLIEGEYFSVKVVVGPFSSNTANFLYIKSIVMNKSNLNASGGSTTFSGSYKTSNTNITTLMINSLSCSITSLSPTSITFTYPPLSAGTYKLLLNIGGFDYSTLVTYKASSNQPSSSDSDDSDSVSNSSKLSISIILSAFFFILYLFL